MITPPKAGSGGGSCLPLMVVVALGEPGVPVVSTAPTGAQTRLAAASKPAAAPSIGFAIMEALLKVG